MSQTTHTPREIIEYIKNTYINRLKENGISVDSVFFFGSRIRGDYLEDSDIDLLVISPDFKNIDIFKRLILLNKLWDYPIPAEITGYTKEEIRRLRKFSQYVRDATTEGIKL
jgi:predicted nucleotidyltransferase